MENITIVVAEQKSNNCLEGCDSSAADSYINFQDNIDYCLEGSKMQVKKSIRIPVHYDTTNTKIGILDRLTARITYCIMLISNLIDETTKLDRTTIRVLVNNSDIANLTGLSYGLRDQCIDKAIWAWKSYKNLHKKWESKVKKAKERIASARDERVLGYTQRE